MESKRRLIQYLIPSIADLFLVTVLCSLFFTENSALLSDGDTGYHVRAGEEILKTGSVPHFDMFSQHAPPIPWTAHEWLSEVIMALAHRAAGMTGVVAMSSLLLAATFWLLFRALMNHQTGIVPAALVTTATVVCSQLHWLARPHLFTFLLLVVFHYLLESWHKRGGNALYLLPPIMLLWGNLHGGFAVGFLLLAAYLAGTLAGMAGATGAARNTSPGKAKELGAAALACVAAALVNPYGWRILLFPFRLVTDRYLMGHVAEFLPPSIHGWLPFNCLLLLLLALLALSRKKMDFKPGWDKVLEKYGITWIMFEADSRFSRFLQQRSDWKSIYSDEVAKVFVKHPAGGNQLPPRTSLLSQGE